MALNDEERPEDLSEDHKKEDRAKVNALRGIGLSGHNKKNSNDQDENTAVLSSQEMQSESLFDENIGDFHISVKTDIEKVNRDGNDSFQQSTTREISIPGNAYTYVMRSINNNGECSHNYELRNNLTGEITDLSFLKDNIEQRALNILTSPESVQLIADAALMMGTQGMSPETVHAAGELIRIGVEFARNYEHENSQVSSIVNTVTNSFTRNTASNSHRSAEGEGRNDAKNTISNVGMMMAQLAERSM